MAFMKDILTRNIPIWEECAATPFVQEVQTGKLPLEKFKRYMIQDSIYLKNYARIYGKAIFHADTLREIQLYYSMLNFVNDTESEVRLDYLKQFCITDDDIELIAPLPENQNYIDFMFEIASHGKNEEILMAVLPCMLSYSYIFRKLAAVPTSRQSRYWDFIKDYADEQYAESSGGAGIQADLKTFSAHGVFGMSVIVSVVAENTSRVIDIQDITPDMIEKQIDAVFEDIEVDAVKIGMLSTPECMKAVAKKLLQYKPQNVVIDPVMYAKNGCPLMNPTAVSTLIDTVIPLADVLTPNIPEAEKIADMQISTVSDMEAAARKIYAMGCKAIVVKGGHHIGNAVDVLFNGENFYHFETSRIDTKNTHGTGCTFSSAIASQLAKGKSVPLAVESAKAYVTMAIEHSLAIGKGCGPTHHFYELYQHGLSKE